MRAHTQHPAKPGRNPHRVTRTKAVARPVPDEEPRGFEMFSDRLDDRAEYERIIRDFVSVHDAVLAADEYDS